MDAAVHILLVLGLLSLISLTAAADTVSASPTTWSDWYNTDSPKGSGVDDESLLRVTRVQRLPCDLTAVERVECRAAGSGVTFTNQAVFVNNVLLVPCNATGLVCRDVDQSSGGHCSDFEIRVSCSAITDKTTSDPSRSAGVGIGSNGGFIAMAAGGSVVIPLVCVLVVQLRKSKREERRRSLQAARAARQATDGDPQAQARDAPPAYDELFGSSDSRISTTSTSSSGGDSGIEVGSTEMLMVSEVRPGVASTSTLLPAEPPPSDPATLVSSVVVLQPPADGAASMNYLSLSSAAMDAPGTAGPHVSLQVFESSPPIFITTLVIDANGGISGRRESFASDLSDSSVDGLLVTSSGASALPQHDGLSETSSHDSTEGLLAASPGPAPADQRSDTATYSSTALLPSSPSVVHLDPPPPYDLHPSALQDRTVGERCRSCGRSSSNDRSSNSDDNSASDSVPQQPQRRYVGMHVSIQDLLAAAYQEQGRASTPPPTYDDALKIIAVHGQLKVAPSPH